MEEFEKWYKENCDFSSAGIWADEYVKEAWKAALEWAANQIKNDVNGYFNILKELEKP